MRPEALNFMVCPNCAGELTLSSDAPHAAEDGHVMAGSLACRTCPSQFAIGNGVPILLPANLAKEDAGKGATPQSSPRTAQKPLCRWTWGKAPS